MKVTTKKLPRFGSERGGFNIDVHGAGGGGGLANSEEPGQGGGGPKIAVCWWT